MDQTWQTQKATPLFEDILWSRPENKATAGKLLLIGGSSHGFAYTYQAFEEVSKKGIGKAKLILPDSLRKVIQHELVEFAPSTHTGSFEKEALNDIVAYSHWANATWLTGDFTKNSETNLLIDELLTGEGRFIVGGDTIDHFLRDANALIKDSKLLLLEFKQFQPIAARQYGIAVSHDMPLPNFIEAVNQFSSQNKSTLLISHDNGTVYSHGGSSVSTSAQVSVGDIAASVVLWVQFPNRPLQAVATGPFIE